MQSDTTLLPWAMNTKRFCFLVSLCLLLPACGHLKRRSEIQATDPATAERQSLLNAYPLTRLNQAVVFLREGADQDPGHEAEFCGLNPTDALHLMIPLKGLREEKITQVNMHDPMEGLNCRSECAKKFTWVCKSELLEYLKKTVTQVDE